MNFEQRKYYLESTIETYIKVLERDNERLKEKIKKYLVDNLDETIDKLQSELSVVKQQRDQYKAANESYHSFAQNYNSVNHINKENEERIKVLIEENNKLDKYVKKVESKMDQLEIFELRNGISLRELEELKDKISIPHDEIFNKLKNIFYEDYGLREHLEDSNLQEEIYYAFHKMINYIKILIINQRENSLLLERNKELYMKIDKLEEKLKTLEGKIKISEDELFDKFKNILYDDYDLCKYLKYHDLEEEVSDALSEMVNFVKKAEKKIEQEK